MAVPLLVSKALELFLQDLCDRTYEITLKRGAKTMNSLHLKQCVHTFNVFDFLKDIVSKVPDLGGSDTAGEDRSVAKRRKVNDGEDNASDEESKRSKLHEAGNHSAGSGRGRGRGRGRPRGRGSRVMERETAAHQDKFEDDPDISKYNENDDHNLETLDDRAEPEGPKVNVAGDKNAEGPIRNFDLNVDLNENGDLTTQSTPAPVPTPTPNPPPPPAGLSGKTIPEMKHEEYPYPHPGWSLADVEKMAIDPIQLANLNRRMDEDDEDYDEEG
ncbi:Transcription initiation factor [Parasponia andersonii]|uniref:Transcription initiation factor n=1 Tax=Parasponia andersonii TaxID=3476 RepID=A0A2P5DLD7_PARAD|nr:Transcription initiation factor [Parasponia andersonii]